MKTISEHNLLCEYIGYVLQTEHHISLNKLLIEAYEHNMHKEVLPFVEECLEYEEDCSVLESELGDRTYVEDTEFFGY